VAGLCPTTEANLGDGLFPLGSFLAAGGALGVGSDSHVSVSPVEELRWLEYGQRLMVEGRNVAGGFPHASTARSLLEAAWSGGSRALGFAAGALAEGFRADLLVLDPDHPLLAGRTDDLLLDSWVFSGNVTPVRHVMVGGRWVVRDGRHPREEETLDRYRRVTRELARRS
jgi:formimidoylglutamate deiminase